MKKIVLIALVLNFLLFLSSTSAVENQVYFLNLNYNKGNISLLSFYVDKGFVPDRKIQPEIGYNLEVVSFSGKTLDSFKFDIPNKIFTPMGMITKDSANFTLIVQYFNNSKAINIYDSNNTKKLSINVSVYSTVRETPLPIEKILMIVALAILLITAIIMFLKIF
jgi:hypothetical protein